MRVYESSGEQDTLLLAADFARSLKAGSIVCLEGDLGVGKTVFAKGFAEGLGIAEDIVSPTFTLVQSYKTEDTILHHFDMYRISDESELEEIGYEEYFFSEAFCLVEWASRIPTLLPQKVYRVCIEKDLEKGFDYRKISVWQEGEA